MPWKMMILTLCLGLQIGCATTKPTVQAPRPPDYVSRADVDVVRPGQEFCPGAVNTTTNIYWRFTKLGLKATIIKACDKPDYASSLLEE